jgi:hypothetical protein
MNIFMRHQTKPEKSGKNIIFLFLGIRSTIQPINFNVGRLTLAEALPVSPQAVPEPTFYVGRLKNVVRYPLM